MNNKKLGSFFEGTPDRKKYENMILIGKQRKVLFSVFRESSGSSFHGIFIEILSWKT